MQYVDPLGTLLGDLPTIRDVFCASDDRRLAVGQEDELRARLRVVLQRTLRRQAQEFLETPFVDRQARLFEYSMSQAERELYDDVTRYLLEPMIIAFQGRQRQLLLLSFHQTAAVAAQRQRAQEIEARVGEQRGALEDAGAELKRYQSLCQAAEECLRRASSSESEQALRLQEAELQRTAAELSARSSQLEAQRNEAERARQAYEAQTNAEQALERSRAELSTLARQHEEAQEGLARAQDERGLARSLEAYGRWRAAEQANLRAQETQRELPE